MKYNDKNKKICEKLGALQFQKLVFIVEKIKFKIMKKFFPNIYYWVSKNFDKKMENMLLNAKTEEEKNKIINYFRFEKMKFKRELNREENNNYHINFKNVYEINNYLEKNKEIHKKSLKSNIIISIILIILSLIISNPTIFIFLSYEILGIIINFECINLQNYNLCRISDEKVIKTFNKIQERQQKDFKVNMSEGSKVIYNSFVDTVDIPDVDTVISHINTKEEAMQLLNYARKQINNNQRIKKLKK